MIPLAHGQWLARRLGQTNLVTYPGEGHLGPMRHWRELLEVLVGPPS